MNTPLSQDQKILLEQGKLLPLMEDFYSIQGEGFNTGKAAYFIRLGGCDMGCWWCDVKESWDASLHPLTSTDEIVDRVLQQPAKSVVVTGGEPVLYNLDYLCKKLKDNGIETFLETAGVRPLTGLWDWICLSPKKGSLPLPEYFREAAELKVIIHQESDFRWAELNAEKITGKCHLYLQPEWSKYNQILPSIVNYIKKHPQWKISLQSHKFMNIP
ncbi:MAG: 7-carboxy-7-deazaguanine synthase QueE [Bacteroidales bacterium]|nr:7-carboxy-7-deazaguanine synthase QueE [Bacteroidales bacterium]